MGQISKIGCFRNCCTIVAGAVKAKEFARDFSLKLEKPLTYLILNFAFEYMVHEEEVTNCSNSYMYEL